MKQSYGNRYEEDEFCTSIDRQPAGVARQSITNIDRHLTVLIDTHINGIQLFLFVPIEDFLLFCHWFVERRAFPSESASGPSWMPVGVVISIIGDIARIQVKWEEVVASPAKVQQKQDPKTTRPDRTERYEKPSQRPARDSGNRNRGRYQNWPIEKAKGMAVSTWPDISHLYVSRPELINVLRQMGQQVNGISHAAAKKSTRNAKHGLEAAKPKRLLLGTDEISFTAKEQEKVLTPHHDSLVISLTVANCLVKRILVDNEALATSSSRPHRRAWGWRKAL
ncbi:hypothetical protein F2Q70_00035906 [Brassica cretica]|uniref:Uncharacterized protein n=1 Tax=Brassica cretica TaxID=69181 RepID=A0A8S9JWY5_BRACR|nr:hypothetical protein F2Q70_00035906 [Brassica cretica]